MYQVVVPSDAKRAKLNRAIEALQIDLKDYIVSEHTLRLEKLLVAGQNAYDFDLYQNPGSDRPLENKLNRNDVLIITELALAITKQDATTTPPRYANYPLYHFPDPAFFLGVPAAGLTEAQCLETVYNGKLAIKTNNTERLPGLLTAHFRYAPNRTTATTVHAEYGPEMAGRGFFPTEPHVILNGQQNNSVRLGIGAGETTVIAGGISAAAAALDTRNVCVLLIHGFLVSEAAEAALRWNTY